LDAFAWNGTKNAPCAYKHICSSSDLEAPTDRHESIRERIAGPEWRNGRPDV
jgi:hypothetical protein